MNLTHVLAFHRVAAAGGFTLAARLSGLSQPTLSAQVRNLERTCGAALFERSGRQIRLTPAGQTLFEATARLADAIDGVERALAGTRAGVRGSLKVTADSAVHVIPVLAAIKRRAAGFAFSLRIANSATVVAEVLGEKADVGVTAEATADPRLFSAKIREDRLVLLVPAADSLARRRRVRLDELAGRDLVVREKGSITRSVLEARLAAAAVRSGQVFDVATRDAVGEAVAAGFGVGVVFASEAGADARVATVDIAAADVSVGEYVICRAERQRLGLVARFVDESRREALAAGWLERKG